jgi:uncharacterized protein YjiS (DUF1127 family)
MTHIGSSTSSTMTAGAPGAGFGAGSYLVGRIWNWIWRPVMIDRQRRQLNQLSDRILKDIGLSRGEIDGISVHLIDRHADGTRRRRGR